MPRHLRCNRFHNVHKAIRPRVRHKEGGRAPGPLRQHLHKGALPLSDRGQNKLLSHLVVLHRDANSMIRLKLHHKLHADAEGGQLLASHRLLLLLLVVSVTSA